MSKEAILSWLEGRGKVSVLEICQGVGKSEASVQKNCRELYYLNELGREEFVIGRCRLVFYYLDEEVTKT